VVIRAFFGEKAREIAENPQKLERPIKHLLPIIILSFMVILFGVYAGLIIPLIEAGVAFAWTT
jgi:formate hydrogenlyase subunit 3/multisubunit Na+/H+ antiporter MnhD subunit